MIDTSAFTKLVPGFDFLNSLMQNAGQATPAMGQWVAPTLDPAELEKRISELKTVQFWLEQNAHMIGVTVQALEVQRMTLSTLQSMNLDLRSALSLRETAGNAPAPSAAAAPVPAAPDAAAPESPMSSFARAFGAPAAGSTAAPAPSAAATAEAGGTPAKPAIDPAQWWGALTQQFTDLATKALQDGQEIASRQMADAKSSLAQGAAAKPAAARKAAPVKSTDKPADTPAVKPPGKRP